MEGTIMQITSAYANKMLRSLEEDIVDYYDPNKNFKRWITF